jgi:hypothetical protein
MRFNNKGLAMPMIIMILAIIMIICTVAFIVAENQTLSVSNTKVDEDALHIAEAGYYRYLWYMNDNSEFYKVTTKITDEFDPEEFYTSANPVWNGYPKKYKVTEYKDGGKTLGYYQIEIKPPTTAEPVVTIISTGWSASDSTQKRAIEVKIHKREFTNYVDFSGDMKTPDGDNLYWGNGEQARGPVFTNGTLRTDGVPVFHDNVTYVTGKDFRNGSPSFLKSGQPTTGTALAFPTSNSELVYWADAARGGYKYTNRTCIYMDGSTLYIRNVNTSNDDKITRMLPSSGVIHVNGDVFISGKLDGRLTVVAEGNIFITWKDPTNFSYSSATATGGITYSNQNIPTNSAITFANPCDDMLGLVANGTILINTRYWPKQNSNSFNSVSAASSNIKVQAAIFGLSNNSYYGVDNYTNLGNMGYIYFTGSKISGRIGATYQIGGGNSIRGYREDNSFDYRMLYEMPPHFLEPVNSGWEVKEWNEK